MHTGIVIAIISALPALVTAVVSVALNNRVIKNDIAHVKEDIARIEAKVDKHNNFMERIALLESNSKAAWKQIDEIKDSIHELQDFHK
jgi:peptidoglycan hydrolase CwlO-like protein